MEKKLTKHGKSVTLILDKEVLKLLNVDETGIVNLSFTDKGLLIAAKKKKTVIKKPKDDDKVADELITKYKATFKKLAKT